MSNIDNLTGAILGHLAGDALGVPYEFKRPEDLPEEISWTGGGSHGQPPGTWSDDGAMMLCTAASLLESGGFDSLDLGRRFVAWFDEGYMAAGGRVFDYGRSTLNALSLLRRGTAPDVSGQSGEMDNGNGSLMRILPLSLWTCALTVREQVALSHQCSSITHAHARSQVSCAMYSLLVRHLRDGQALEISWDLAARDLRNEYALEDGWPPAFRRELDLVLEFSGASGTCYVVDTLRSAWLSLFGGDDYPSAVRTAVRLGHDTDTTACVAGGLAGLMYGARSIPAEWRSGLRLEHWQADLIKRFARACPRAGDGEL
ncbi:MAG: ADP-ribosylglycohydrolase family protein [Candidatus Geothermincolia bacterium]